MAAQQPPSKKYKFAGSSAKPSYSGSSTIFNGFSVFIVEDGVGKVRCKVLRQQVQNHGGFIEKEYNASTTTHIFVKKNLKKDKLLKVIGQDGWKDHVAVLHVEWLTACLLKKELVPVIGFEAYQQLEQTEVTA